MHFDATLGNPPYQNGKHKTFYMGFIKKSFEQLKDDSTMTFICPFNWIENQSGNSSNLFKDMSRCGRFDLIQEVNGDDIFNITHRSKLCIFTYTKNPKNGILNNSKIDRINPINSIEESILKKVDLMSILPIKGRGQREFVNEKDKEYKFEVYLSHRIDRQVVYSNKPYPGYGIDKLIVSWIMEPEKVNKHTRIKKYTGVGRYAMYFELPPNKSKNAIKFFSTNIYKFVNTYRKHGNFPYIFLVDLDYNKTISNDIVYSAISLTREEIDYIENAVK